MKNFEKWEKEILALAYDGEGGTSFAVVDNKPVACDHRYCGVDIQNKACMIYPSCRTSHINCSVGRIRWLYSEYVELPKLNKAERAFCESVKTGWIARDKNNAICLYTAVPYKKHDEWCSAGMYFNITMLEDFNSDLTFEFIKWEDDMPWKIADLLELEIEE